MYCAMSESSTATAAAYAGFPLPPGTSESWIPASSLYCCHRSVSRISSAARNRRIAASPLLREPVFAIALADCSVSSDAPIAPAPTAALCSRNDRRFVATDSCSSDSLMTLLLLRGRLVRRLRVRPWRGLPAGEDRHVVCDGGLAHGCRGRAKITEEEAMEPHHAGAWRASARPLRPVHIVRT